MGSYHVKQPIQMLNEFDKQETQLLSSSDEYTFNPETIAYPETARWVLCGLKNLTRTPSKDSLAGQKLIQCGVLPILLQTLNVEDRKYHGFNIDSL